MTNAFFYLAALGLGAFHALEPGHGKTVVAAYLVGSKGRRIDAVILGTIVTLTHTFSVIILGIIAKVASAKWALDDQSLHAYLGLAAGGLILAVGLWMLVGRLRGQEPLHLHSHSEVHSHSHDLGHTHGHDASWVRDAHPHNHGHDDHHGSRPHDHGNGHSHDQALPHRHEHGHDVAPVDVEGEGRVGYWQLSLLGVSGGLVPCPAAMAVLLAGVAAGKIGEALTYVLLFSVGLAASLIAIGLAVVTASSFASRFLDAKKFARKIGIVSAAVITLIGLVTILGSAKHLISILSQTVA